MGYRIAYFDVSFFCPKCVSSTQDLLRDEAGVVAFSVGFRQDVSYVIYDPDEVSLERVSTLMASGGDSIFLSDAGI